METTGLLIGHEKSRQWHRILAGEIPEEVDVFFVLWMDRDSKRFVSETFCLSTSEGAPPNTDPFVACETTVPVVASDGAARRREDLEASLSIAALMLARQFVNDPSKRQIFDQYVRDRREQKRGPKMPVDVIPTRDFEQLFGDAVKKAQSPRIILKTGT